MLIVRFLTDACWRECCDAAEMRRRWGTDRAHLISRRLQQLEAMASLNDLDFMPFDIHRRLNGVVEVVVDADTSLLVQTNEHQQEDTMNIVTITAVHTRSSLVK